MVLPRTSAIGGYSDLSMATAYSSRRVRLRCPPRYAFEQFFAVRRYGDMTFAHDSRSVLYVANTSGQFNLWRQSVRGGWPYQLTAFEEETVRSIGCSPTGGEILFMADRHGTEFHQIYRMRTGWPQPLTDNPKVQYYFHQDCFSPDGAKIAYWCNERVPTDMDLWVLDLKRGEKRLLLGDGKYYAVSNWSPDGQKLLALNVKSNTDQDILLVDLASGAAQNLTPHEGQVVYSPGPWLPDGSGFYLLTDEGREFKGLAFYDLQKGQRRWVETPDWDVETVELSREGRYLAWVVNEDGVHKLYVRDLRRQQLLPLPELPQGIFSAGLGAQLRFSPNGRFLAFWLNTSRRPQDLYVLDLERGRLRQITFAMLGNIPEKDLVEPELVHYETWDGRKIPAWLYKPLGLKSGERCPAVLAIHGGPEVQELPNFKSFYQYLLNRGIGVLSPNYRGSTGYGKSYQKLIRRDWGGGELKDFEHAVKFLHRLDWVDPERIGVVGGSFGGFATLSCVTRLPQYWAAAVDVVGPSNLVTFAKSVPPHWRRFMKEWVGDPDEDREFLRERSPITYVDDVRCPLLVIQGANDPRVVKAESDQMVERLRARGGTVEYLVFEDEGHGFTQRHNELKAYRAAAEFLERYLLAR